MEKMLGPTGRMLVGSIFICLLILLSVAAAEHPADLPDLQKKLKEAKSGPFDHNDREWGSRQLHHSGPPFDLHMSSVKVWFI